MLLLGAVCASACVYVCVGVSFVCRTAAVLVAAAALLGCLAWLCRQHCQAAASVIVAFGQSDTAQPTQNMRTILLSVCFSLTTAADGAALSVSVLPLPCILFCSVLLCSAPFRLCFPLCSMYGLACSCSFAAQCECVQISVRCLTRISLTALPFAHALLLSVRGFSALSVGSVSSLPAPPQPATPRLTWLLLCESHYAVRRSLPRSSGRLVSVVLPAAPSRRPLSDAQCTSSTTQLRASTARHPSAANRTADE